MDPLTLAEGVRWRARSGMTHLKLQKLVFYGFGALVGHELVDPRALEFEAWKHGPVNRTVWETFRDFRGAPIPVPSARTRMAPAVEDCLGDAMEVYGRMSAWQLRSESHREQPWQDARERKVRHIDPSALATLFKSKFEPERVSLPVHLGGSLSADLDFIPPARFASLREMARVLRERGG